ncbi:MAG: hypothetical protein JWP99_612 [Devosia sp.]|nr:hypothetical protein [Devosia sp.]
MVMLVILACVLGASLAAAGLIASAQAAQDNASELFSASQTEAS